jgi:hypothetical protein
MSSKILAATIWIDEMAFFFYSQLLANTCSLHKKKKKKTVCEKSFFELRNFKYESTDI